MVTSLEILIPSLGVSCWQALNNRLKGKPPVPVVWDGVLFSLTKEYSVHPAGTPKAGLASVTLEGPDFMREITADEFDDGDFVFVETRNVLAGPSTDPVEDAKKFWDPSHAPAGPRELSNHVKALEGGLILWRFKQDDVKFEMPAGADPYRFDVAGASVGVQHLNYKGGTPPPIPPGIVNKITFHAAGANGGGPGDLMSPPRYP